MWMPMLPSPRNAIFMSASDASFEFQVSSLACQYVRQAKQPRINTDDDTDRNRARATAELAVQLQVTRKSRSFDSDGEWPSLLSMTTGLGQRDAFRLHIPAPYFEVGGSFAKLSGAIAHSDGARFPGPHGDEDVVEEYRDDMLAVALYQPHVDHKGQRLGGIADGRLPVEKSGVALGRGDGRRGGPGG